MTMWSLAWSVAPGDSQRVFVSNLQHDLNYSDTHGHAPRHAPHTGTQESLRLTIVQTCSKAGAAKFLAKRVLQLSSCIYGRFSPLFVKRRGPMGVGLLRTVWPRLIEPSLLTVTGSRGAGATCSRGSGYD